MEFYSVEDARVRLVHCAFILGDKVVYVEDVRKAGKNYKVYYREVANADEIKTCNVNELSLSPFPLGNVVKQGIAWYLSRIPSRQYRQGLTNATCSAVMCMAGEGRFGVHDPCIQMAVSRNYPSIDEALKNVREGWTHSIPFSYHFSVMGKGKIIYKCREVVGEFTNNHEYILNDEHFFLKELLQEAIK